MAEGRLRQPDPGGEKPVRMRRRNVLRIGFAAVIALLVFSTINAYWVQSSLSEKSLQIYHRHIQHDETLLSLRRTIWLGSNAVRDFLLDPSPERAAAFAGQIQKLRSESRRLQGDLQRLQGRDESLAKADELIRGFWSTLDAISGLAERLSPRQAYRLVQREVVPRRNAVSDGLREVMENNQIALQQDEEDFARTRRAAAQSLLAALGLCLLLGLVVASFSLVYSEGLEREAARRFEEIAQARRELRQLSVRLMDIQEEERTRLSRELHDEIGQILATLRLEIARAESLAGRQVPEVQERTARARELAENAMRIVRDISVLLRPSLLDDLGLGPALQWQVEEFTRRTGVPCELVEQGLHKALPVAVRTCVYRILQESLHNCEKHASASQVRVSIQQSPEFLTMTVEDSGRGFDVRRLSDRGVRLGILGMRERAVALGGTVVVESSPGNGTRVALRLPLNAARTAAQPGGPAEASA